MAAKELHMIRIRNRNCEGMTLVELLVAASILGMAITGVMSMLGIGRQIEAENGLRRQGDMVAANVLESPAYHYSNYPFPAGDVSSAITLSTDAAHTIPATQTVSIADQTTPFNDLVSGSHIDVPYQSVSVKVKWTLNGQDDSVTSRKWVAALQ
jgi:prepilin-type N-terminal cleavage/methylation domain-containing protein